MWGVSKTTFVDQRHARCFDANSITSRAQHPVATLPAPTLCCVCSQRPVEAKNRCHTCRVYFQRKGYDRRPSLCERQREKDARNAFLRLLMRPGDVPIVTLEDLLQRPAWHARAACHDASLDLFVLGPYQSPRPGLALCEGCEVRVECLDFAMADPNLEGTWGGTTTRERRRLRQAAS
jgi:WhiB family redox-sensing transcriptional regulator